MNEFDNDVLRRGPIYFVPSLHGRLEFGVVARKMFYEIKPDAVALELPATIKNEVERGLDRLPNISVVCYQEKNGAFVYLPLEPQDAMVEAGRLARKNNIPLFFVDRDSEGYRRRREAFPDSYTVRRLGLKAYAEAYAREFGRDESSDEDRLREMTMAFHLQDLGRKYQRVLFVCGLAHYPGTAALLDEKLAMPLGRTKREGVFLADLAMESIQEIMTEPPFIINSFIQAGEGDGLEEADRLLLHQDLLKRASEKHFKNSKEQVTQGQLAVLNKFSRNYALVQGFLAPDLFQLLIAARGAVDDNFAYEVWEQAVNYPHKDNASDLPQLRLQGEDLYLDTKKIRFFRRFHQFRRRLVPMPVKKRKREKNPGEWKDAWDGGAICSHPPEDVVVEGFGDYLKKKTVQILSEENRRTRPFTTSMMDGLDIRETIRNWHEKKIYVAEVRPVRGKVGSVVIIFDEDEQDDGGAEAYPWKMSWLGEHEQESDMAFYATPAGANVIGPGVSRCEYGGFMLTYPPLRLYDPWRDPFFDGARTKAERLLLAGVDYSEEKLIAYIAAKPPADRIKTLAGMYGKKIVYLPLGQFSPVTLKKIRTFHVLDGHQVRTWAGEYIY